MIESISLGIRVSLCDLRSGRHGNNGHKIQPQRRADLIEAARQYLPLVRAEPGVEAFYLTARQDDPNSFVFYEIYRSQAAQDFHLQQDFTKKFLATLKNAQASDRVRTNLVELAEESIAAK